MIEPKKIEAILEREEKEDRARIEAILAKALQLQGLELEEAASLLAIKNPELLQQLYKTAKTVKESIYGKRIVIFAPLYISNLCANDCTYCAFRAANQELKRRALTQEEIAQETQTLINQGHKRLLLVAGESYPKEGFSYILNAIETVYDQKTDRGNIRRLNVNIAPLSLDDFKLLAQARIGTYQLFQETYHRPTYEKVHRSGKKKDYGWRLEAIHRAIEAGIEDVGMGVLFGLADWRFDVLALLQHAASLDHRYGIGPHTVSVPRLEPACGSDISLHPPRPVSDEDFSKIISVLRLAIPYTGIILSTRESPATRQFALTLGVSQVSAGSRTNPGGYSENEAFHSQQFSLGDHRSLDEVVRDIASHGYIPSFCTACYRLGRTGEHFMELAKPGKIKSVCEPNAIATFQEYLLDYASPQTRELGEKLIHQRVHELEDAQKNLTTPLIEKLKKGLRDVYV